MRASHRAEPHRDGVLLITRRGRRALIPAPIAPDGDDQEDHEENHSGSTGDDPEHQAPASCLPGHRGVGRCFRWGPLEDRQPRIDGVNGQLRVALALEGLGRLVSPSADLAGARAEHVGDMLIGLTRQQQPEQGALVLAQGHCAVRALSPCCRRP